MPFVNPQNGWQLDWPSLETEHRLMIIGSARPLEDAARIDARHSNFTVSLRPNMGSLTKRVASSRLRRVAAALLARRTHLRGVSALRWPRRNPRWTRFSVAVSSPRAGLGHALAANRSLCTRAKALGRAVVRNQSEDQASIIGDEPAGPVDQLLDHRLQAPAPGRVTNRTIVDQHSSLADQAKYVHRKAHELAHQVVGVELARRQPLQIEGLVQWPAAAQLRRRICGGRSLPLRGVGLCRQPTGGAQHHRVRLAGGREA